MVSLNDRIIVERSLKDTPKAFALFSYLNDKEIIIPQTDISETDRMYYSILDALGKNNDRLFKVSYEELCQRRVLKEQPIIYDNYLLFILIIGVTKFNLESEWLKTVIHFRDTTNEPEKAITTSFINLLNRNYLTTEGITSILLATLIKQRDKDINTTIVKNSFESNKSLVQFLEKDLFIASLYLFTTDYIISISIDENAIKLKSFETVFLKRIKLLQNIVYVLVMVLIIVTWFYAIKAYPQIEKFGNTLGGVLQLIGVGLLAFFLNKIKFLFGKLLKWFFGYSTR